jgi:hypothetical protein
VLERNESCSSALIPALDHIAVIIAVLIVTSLLAAMVINF